MDAYDVIKHPLSTEKSIRMMEQENKLIFVVDRTATKKEIKESIEKMFKVKVVSVNSFVSVSGEKKAYVKFAASNPAIDVATQMGLM